MTTAAFILGLAVATLGIPGAWERSVAAVTCLRCGETGQAAAICPCAYLPGGIIEIGPGEGRRG